MTVQAGLASGAVGTAALNMATYIDMAIRGRPGSSVPKNVVRVFEEKAGVELRSGDTGSGDGRESKADDRRIALGQLLGYGAGLAIGAVYGLARPHLRALPLPLAAAGLGAAAMAASDVPAAALHVTKPTKWGAKGWAADIVPHLTYGFAAALAFEGFEGHTAALGHVAKGGPIPKLRSPPC